ncbi:MAG: hypothetical protein RIR00_730, partial [Pseudomonadota bacterium]
MTPDPLLVLLVAAAYLGLLFGIARFADQRADAGRSVITANVYALSLAVYCTSWTFYGSVGRATSGGLSFLTIYLGPTLMLLCIPVWLKVLRISKAQRLTSIADFIAARYGMSQRLAGCVTVIAVIGIVPYIALQLKAISASFQVLFGTLAGSGDLAWWQDSTAWIAVILALFTILFGTRHLDAAERHEGMVAAVAFESVVKLFAFLAIGLFVVFSLFDGPADLFRRAASLPATARLLGSEAIRPVNWLTLIFLSGLAILLLPRQFQIAIVENKDESHLLRAVWLFPLYLLLINLFVLPVALGGMLHFGHAGNSDLFVLSLPLARGQETLALLAFVGGLSAATGMVIVETIALSTMLCNDLVMPVLLRSEWSGVAASRDMSQLLLRVRRGAIALILGLGYIYFRAAGEAYALVGIGLISFSAVAQFAPALFGGLYWKQATHRGALAGLLAGFTVWLYTLLLPSFARSGWIDPGFVEQGLFGWPALKAQALFGLSGIDEISHCLFWSLLANFAAYIGISLYSQPGALEARQANLFVDALRRRDRLPTAPLWRGNASVEALAKLLERFLGPARAEAQLLRYGESRGLSDWRSLPADAGFVHFAEVQL